MLLIAAPVLSDIDRWWTRYQDTLAAGAGIGELYRLLYQAAVEAEAAWSLLADSGAGTRVFSIRAALVPMALLLTEKDGDILVLDVRIPTQR